MPNEPDDELLNSVRGNATGSTVADPTLERLGALARASRAEVDTPFVEPPADLWDRIEASIGVAVPATPAATSAPAAAPTSIESKRTRRATATWLLAAAAAIGLVFGVAGTLIVRRDPKTESVVLERAKLEPLQETGSGTAKLVRTGSKRELSVQLDLPAPKTGFYEVWLIDKDVKQLVSLGPVRADGRYAVPNELDAATFPIVDVSLEDLDGNPKHSGDSLLRGTLAA